MSADSQNVMILKNILESMNFMHLPRQFQQNIMVMLGINQRKHSLVMCICEMLASIYNIYRGDYQQFLNQPNFYGIYYEVKNFLWEVFRRYSQYQKSKKAPQKNTNSFIKQPNLNETNQNLSMNMVNMFLNVPDLNSTQQIQIFQKTMFQACKTAIPQILQGLYSSQKKMSNNYFPQQSFMNPAYNPPLSEAAFASKNLYQQDYHAPSFIKPSKNIDSNENNQNFTDKFKMQSNHFFTNFNSIKESPIRSQAFNFGSSNFNKVFSKDFQDSRDRVGFQKYQSLNKQYQQIDNQPRKRTKKNDDQLSIYSEYTSNNIDSPSQQLQEISCTCKLSTQKNCTYCDIKTLDPSHQTLTILKVFTIYDNNQNILNYQITPHMLNIINNNKDHDIQLRCMKVGAQKQINWAQRFKVAINDEVVVNFIETNNRKKRISRSLLIKQFLEEEKVEKYNQSVTLRILNNQKFDPDQEYFKPIQYCVGIFLIKKYSVQRMREILNETMKIKNVTQFLKKNDEDNEQKLIVSCLDPLTDEIIEKPVRGDKCQHPQCFDLKAYLPYMMLGDVIRWKCPICRNSMNNLQKDEYLEKVFFEICKASKIPKNIIINSDGSHSFKDEKQADELLSQEQKGE